jgi:dTDP-glucose 4,6-dehydratase
MTDANSIPDGTNFLEEHSCFQVDCTGGAIMRYNNLLITGGCGFIGSNFVRHVLNTDPNVHVIVLDKLTYAARLENLEGLTSPRLEVVIGDIGNLELVRHLVQTRGIDAIINFAAETHVDRSILDPFVFSQTNLVGTHTLLEVAREHHLRFHQISTDEVYGHVAGDHHSLETDPLHPRSPYSATKAAADLLVLSYHTTFGLPVTITRGANNVGPYQYLEKVVPLFTTNALLNLPLPVYGDGKQVRDYTHVIDHCTGALAVLERGRIGEVYNVGAESAITNLEMIELILHTVQKPRSLIRHVTDRAGHDGRYSISVEKLRGLSWQPSHTPQQAVVAAAAWYRDHPEYWQPIRQSAGFQAYYDRQYAQRLVEVGE